MKDNTKIILITSALFLCILISCLTVLVSCDIQTTGSRADTQATINAANALQTNQPTPTDIDYSLERYNLIKRAYWVNGQREKAQQIVCAIDRPLGYIVLFTENGGVVGRFIVDGKVTSLNSYLTPDSEWYESGSSQGTRNDWLADIDGSYGTNDNGIFFFTPDGKYVEWTGIYLYSDIPFEIDDPVIRIEGEKNGQ